jgi:O-succinylbenzoic acid--CoA ligase
MEPWLLERAGSTPGATAIAQAERELTFADLADGADAVARRLAACGVAPGARVAVIGDPTVRTIEIVHAVQSLGAVLVPINARLARREIDALLARARPALVLHDARHAAIAPPGSIEMTRGLDEVGGAFRSPRVTIDPDDLHSIVFTSGTTAASKGVMLTHAAHRASALVSAQRLGTTPRSRWLLCMPIFHVGGLSIVLRSAITGLTIVLEERFDQARVHQVLHRGQADTVSLVPTMLDRMLGSGGGGDPYPRSLRCALVGGAPLPPALAARARAARVPIAPTYGLTETCSQVATAAPSATEDFGGSVGHPLPGVEVRIADADESGLGVVLVSGPIVMRGYLDNEEATRAALRAGWLTTGDLGRLDEKGRLQIEGRRSDLIITGGENVMPQEVETVLASHPEVADVAVYGVPDDRWGERLVAAVVPAGDGVDQESLRAWCRARLAGYKTPTAFVTVASLPRTASGKLLRKSLRPIRKTGLCRSGG